MRKNLNRYVCVLYKKLIYKVYMYIASGAIIINYPRLNTRPPEHEVVTRIIATLMSP